MKTLKYLISAIAIFIGIQAFGQTHEHKNSSAKTDTFKVAGNCSMCKSRIEKAAKTEGVTKAEWNQKSKILTVTYNPAKVKSDDIQKKVAAAGHDTEKFKADDKTYENLPGCCQYERTL